MNNSPNTQINQSEDFQALLKITESLNHKIDQVRMSTPKKRKEGKPKVKKESKAQVAVEKTEVPNESEIVT